MKKLLAHITLLGGLLLPVFGQAVNTVVASTNGLTEPFGVAVDNEQNLYVTDSALHRIVRYRIATGQTSTFAGKAGEAGARDGALSSALFSDPKDILFARGGLVVADSGNNALRFINLQSQTVTTLAGGLGISGHVNGPAAEARFRLPRGLAADASGNIYISDFRSRMIRKLDINNIVSTVVTGLAGPSGIALGSNGELYIADRTANQIKVLEPDGSLRVIAGSGVAGAIDGTDALEAAFSLPEDVLWMGEELGLLVSDYENHALRRIYLNKEEGKYWVKTYAGGLKLPGLVDDELLKARFNLPTRLVPYSTGFLIVEEGSRTVRQILTSPAPPVISNPQIGRVVIRTDPETGIRIAVLVPVVDQTFDNDQIIAIVGDDSAVHHFTTGPARTNLFQPDPVPDPTSSSPTAPRFFDKSPPEDVPASLASPLPALTVKAFSVGRTPAEGRTPSSIVSATFRFQVAPPTLDSQKLPGSLMFLNTTANAEMWYTLDGSEPTQGAALNPSSIGPLFNSNSIPLIVSKSNITVKAKAFRANYSPSATSIASFSPTNYVPNRITLGYETGEASSDFVASAGQRFYAPVTLSLLPNSTMYGLNFSLTVAPETGPPSTNYQMSFESMLFNQITDGVLERIPPATLAGFRTNISVIVIDGSTFTVTNIIGSFTNLLVTNVSQHLLGVGWLERKGRTNLYDTGKQDLISFSIPHDTVFSSKSGRVVPGGFSFVIPTQAADGDTYVVEVGRASATADGIGQDVYIHAPGEDDLSPIKAIRRLTVGSRSYIVGDVAPFRWFNAGDFGDTNILNNDLTQFQQSIVYGLNLPPPGSDFADAFDTCCLTLDKTDLASSFEASNGNDARINEIAFGDGVLNIADLFVAFRRATDPTTVWYERYWSNGVLHAQVRSNEFRGGTGFNSLSRQSQSPGLADVPNGDPIRVQVQMPDALAMPGEVVRLPVQVKVTGGLPMRALLLRAKVETLDGAVPVQSPLRFLPSTELGAATYVNSDTPQRYGAAWLDTTRPGISENATIGLLQMQVPTNATAAAVYRIVLEEFSASPNGIYLLPVEKESSVVVMKSRTFTSWTDEISAEWRTQYFGSALNYESRPDGDPDGDGADNLSEYRAGTNPTDRNDVLKLRASIAGDGSVGLEWKSVAGKRYLVDWTDRLEAPNWRRLGDPVDGNGKLLQQNDQASGTRFYRLTVAP